MSRATRVGKPSGVVVLDVSWLAPADLEAVDALARMQLAMARRGVRLGLRHPSSDLLGLLRLVGLADILAPVEDPARKRSGQTPGTARRMPR